MLQKKGYSASDQFVYTCQWLSVVIIKKSHVLQVTKYSLWQQTIQLFLQLYCYTWYKVKVTTTKNKQKTKQTKKSSENSMDLDFIYFGGWDVAQLVRALDRHATDLGSIPLCGKGFFS